VWALDDVDVIVANHDLVLADLSLGGGAILSPPEETLYVLDEGHHLAEKALNHFACHTRVLATIRWLGQTEGQWANFIAPLADATHFMTLAQPVETHLKEARSLLDTLVPHLQNLSQLIERQERSQNKKYRHGRHGPKPVKPCGRVLATLKPNLIGLWRAG